MQPLSAIDAISPAWDHTRKLLLNPVRWQTMLKIGLVAAFAGTGSFNFNSNSIGRPGGIPHGPLHLPAIALVASFLLVIGVVFLVVWFAFFYLSARLQFVMFDFVLRRDTTIGPIWSRFGPATWRWMGLRFLFTVGAMVLFSPILIPAVLGFIHSFPKGGTAPDLPSFFGTLMAFLGAILLVAIVIGLGTLLLHDFGLPSMALEGTPLQETAARVLRLMRAEPLQVFLYVVMRVVLQIAIAIGTFIGIFISCLILLIPFGALGGILWATLHGAGMGARVGMWAMIAMLVLAFAAVVLVAIFMLASLVGTFFQAYSLYFLGGRYPLLGELLQPTPEPPPSFFYATPPPPIGLPTH